MRLEYRFVGNPEVGTKKLLGADTGRSTTRPLNATSQMENVPAPEITVVESPSRSDDGELQLAHRTLHFPVWIVVESRALPV